MPKADATELAPKKSAALRLRQRRAGGPVVFLLPARLLPGPSLTLPGRPKGLKSPYFFGEASERRPWAIKREDRPTAFAGRSFFPRFISIGDWDSRRAYTGEYPIPPR